MPSFALEQSLFSFSSLQISSTYTVQFSSLLMSMQTLPLDHSKLEEIILSLDPAKPDCRLRIADVRRDMDHSCDKGLLTIGQWRRLLDAVSAVQSRCIGSSPGSNAFR